MQYYEFAVKLKMYLIVLNIINVYTKKMYTSTQYFILNIALYKPKK